jgi:hypothetical protein
MNENPHNLCRSCNQDFASVSLFDAHRVGVHEYTYSEGVKMEPIREDGRRCLDTDELEARGWVLDKRGIWTDPVGAAACKARFQALTI